ncbi:hypothetical protein ACET3Z_007681 [Daucus carota]
MIEAQIEFVRGWTVGAKCQDEDHRWGETQAMMSSQLLVENHGSHLLSGLTVHAVFVFEILGPLLLLSDLKPADSKQVTSEIQIVVRTCKGQFQIQPESFPLRVHVSAKVFRP